MVRGRAPVRNVSQCLPDRQAAVQDGGAPQAEAGARNEGSLGRRQLVTRTLEDWWVTDNSHFLKVPSSGGVVLGVSRLPSQSQTPGLIQQAAAVTDQGIPYYFTSLRHPQCPSLLVPFGPVVDSRGAP